MRKNDLSIAVIILTMNQCQKTLRCLESLAGVLNPTHHIVLWDNGSEDGTAAWVRERFPSVTVIHHPCNAGVASGRNMAAKTAIEAFHPGFLFFMDNDMTVTPGVLEALLDPFRQHKKLAQTTGKILDMDNPDRIYGAGGNRIRFWLGDTRHVGYGEIDKGQYNQPHRCIPSGGCMLVRTDIFQQLGGFDPCFDPYGPEDLDFGLKVIQVGYYGEYVPEAIVFHESKPGRTFEGGQYTEKFATLRVQHWLTFMKRHASFLDKLGFILIGVPYLLGSFIVRQARRKKLISSIKGLFRGTIKAVFGSPTQD
jgi:hypothetical protein